MRFRGKLRQKAYAQAGPDHTADRVEAAHVDAQAQRLFQAAAFRLQALGQRRGVGQADEILVERVGK
jgi:t-SNARE complex subunit (syntaxin)